MILIYICSILLGILFFAITYFLGVLLGTIFFGNVPLPMAITYTIMLYGIPFLTIGFGIYGIVKTIFF
jgi:hypothetical protein